VWYANNSGNNYFPSEICAIMPSTRGVGLKNKNLGGFSPGKEAQKLRWDRNSYGCGIISDHDYPSKKSFGVAVPWHTFLRNNLTESSVYSGYQIKGVLE
jgi:hypothetical protein